jgi:hypothetical protein
MSTHFALIGHITISVLDVARTTFSEITHLVEIQEKKFVGNEKS